MRNCMVSMTTHCAISENRVFLQKYSYLSSKSSYNTKFGTWFRGSASFVYLLCCFCLFLLCFRACLFVDALWSPAWRGLGSWLSFVMSNCEVVTFPWVTWVRCGSWLYRFQIFAIFLTYQIYSKTLHFNLLIGYANYLIWICMNFNEFIRKEWKMWKFKAVYLQNYSYVC